MELTGFCYILLGFDIGFQVDLNQCAKLISGSTQRITIAPRHRAPKHFRYRALPLGMTQQGEQIQVGNFKTSGTVELSIFDFGAVSLCYRIPINCDLSGLLDLSSDLYDNQAIAQDSARRVESLLNSIKPSVAKPLISGFVEDYLIFEVKRDANNRDQLLLINSYKEQIAQILRSEKLPLSQQEIGEALAEQISYTPSDSVIVNWNAAFVFDDSADDVRAVLEFANLQLLEMRYLDQQLDNSLEQSYELLAKHQRSIWPLFFKAFDVDLNKIGQLQADAALLYQGISSSLKLLGDQYLSRIYNMATRRFFLLDWSGSINRKLQTLENIYQKLEDKIESMRMQVMELIIVLLFLIDIAMVILK